MDITQGPFVGRSQALRTNWCYYHPARMLIDAGDGVAVDLGDRVGSPQIVCMTHAHSDHILGLFNLALSRQLPSTVSGGPLTIYYPAASHAFDAIRASIAALWSRTIFDRITWTPVLPDARIPFSPTRSIVPYKTEHIADTLTLGYAVTHQRTRLRADMSRLSQAEINTLISTHGRQSVVEPYIAVEFSHTGDARAVSLDTSYVKSAQVAVVDCTFLEWTDKDYDTHASLDEIVEVLGASAIPTLVLHHISQRYDRSTLQADLCRLLSKKPLAAKRVLLWDDTTITDLSAL